MRIRNKSFRIPKTANMLQKEKKNKYLYLYILKTLYLFYPSQTFGLDDLAILDGVEDEVLDLDGQVANVQAPLLRHAPLDGRQRGALLRPLTKLPETYSAIRQFN